jgi:hypothetical protein
LATGSVASAAAGGGCSAAGVDSAQLAADDILVVEVADPGKGFLARPIPTAFLQYLRYLQSQAQPPGSSLGGSTAQEQDLCMAEGELEVELPGSGDEGGEEAGLNINGSTQPKPTTAAAAAAAAGPQPAPAQRRQFRVNKAVRQRWCFRRALVRALLLLQQQHLGSPASAGGAEQQREDSQQQQQEQQRRRPRRGKGSAAAPSSLGGVVAPWQQGRWHPSFDTEAVTSDQLAAAGNLLAAPLRAAAAAAEQEASAADALQAARRSRRRDAAAPAAPAAAAAGGVAAGLLLAGAKPPQLLKQHAPCTDTTEVRCSVASHAILFAAAAATGAAGGLACRRLWSLLGTADHASWVAAFFVLLLLCCPLLAALLPSAHACFPLTGSFLHLGCASLYCCRWTPLSSSAT